ncbi:hypothetical protein DFQ28_007198 [Apophysomyces sp. BC1034]|nr:hypothetical protein DFQ30_007107 [Apophysomyces sp. BC1015]KAG0178576.1 hypothetical protein DFQ29_003294 [Apophysomyces sp. BC1021]KAG0186857.1 hypothetical protein DFQ28_007198 [Apophysomyces sp. BC1034]
MFVNEFPHGFFFIRCKAKAMAIDVNGGSMTNEAHIIIWPQKYVDSINQTLTPRRKVIDIRGGDVKKDKSIIQYARKPGLAHNQRWKYQDGYIFPAADPNLVLDIRGGDYKETNSIYLNKKDLQSQTQQWLIEPFHNEKSDAELALLCPSPLQPSSLFPKPEELYDCYRAVYREQKPNPTSNELAGAAAFKVRRKLALMNVTKEENGQAMKMYIADQKAKNEQIANDTARSTLEKMVTQEVLQLLENTNNTGDKAQLLREAGQAAQSYFAREYEVC